MTDNNKENFNLYVYQLQYFKEHTIDETKMLIFKILKKLPRDVHQPILTILDKYEEWKMIDALTNYYKYESSEFSDPEEEYERRLLKQSSSKIWYTDSSGNGSDG